MVIKTVEFIAHKGPKYTIEWYYNDKFESAALEYFENLSSDRQKKLAYLFKTMCLIGEIQDITKFRHEPDAIYVFKPKPDRFFCFFVKGKKIIVTNAYEKKTDKLSSRDHVKAKKLRNDYIIRCEKGTYYEKKNL